jgi:hypothetical protein
VPVEVDDLALDQRRRVVGIAHGPDKAPEFIEPGIRSLLDGSKGLDLLLQKTQAQPFVTACRQ